MTVHASPTTRHWWPGFLFIAIAASGFRLLDLGAFVTVDEVKFWIPRSHQFLQALQTGAHGDIPIVGHPGVTTMWLGSAGVFFSDALFDHGILHQETYPTLLTLYRLPSALVHIGGILVGYALLRRMVPASVAFLAALLWATDPFVLAFSRVLHVDALAGTFGTLSLLMACSAWSGAGGRRSGGSRGLAALSGGCAGFALLSKLPALALAPVVGVLAFAVPLRSLARPSILRSLLLLLIWAGGAVATVVACWPVFWDNPIQAYHALRYGIESEGGQPHLWGNFFLGRPDEVPGLSYYPVALVLRTTPWTLAGVLLLPLAFRGRGSGDGEERRTESRSLTALAGFGVLFVVGLTLFPKKLDRYLVPAFPALDILAAAGLVWGIEKLARSTRRGTQGVRYGSLALLVVVSLLNAAWYHPYAIVAGNQVFGGARTGAWAFLSGWGEGLDQVAAWLNQQPDITEVVTVTRLRSVLSPFLRTGAYATAEQGRLPDGAGYVVIYLRDLQRPLPPPYDQFYGRTLPLHAVTIHGVDYAWIYHVPPRDLPHPLDVTFGSVVRVSGYELDPASVRASGVLTLTMQWQALAPFPESVNLFVHVLDPQGQKVGQVDVPLSHLAQPTKRWQPGRYALWQYPVVLPPDLPPGTYWLALGLYHPDDFTRLLLDGSVAAPPDAPDDGGDVLFLEPVMIEMLEKSPEPVIP
ncbi:MAG: hypothetical protein HC884_15945 [Chloroflexaceae bacterium]|nr:hypothetical protein [Chloroflexaceae bacterium]